MPRTAADRLGKNEGLPGTLIVLSPISALAFVWSVSLVMRGYSWGAAVLNDLPTGLLNNTLGPHRFQTAVFSAKYLSRNGGVLRLAHSAVLCIAKIASLTSGDCCSQTWMVGSVEWL